MTTKILPSESSILSVSVCSGFCNLDQIFARSTDNPENVYRLEQKNERDKDMEQKMNPVGQIYKHYRNRKNYKVLALAQLETNLPGDPEIQLFVIYQALYDDPVFGSNCVWARRYSEFMGMVEIKTADGKTSLIDRFEKISL